MKKLFTLLLLSISISISSYAGDTSSVKDAIIEAKDAIVDITGAPDSASLSFSKIYTDVKVGISALASSLKVGAEHVYGVLVKQQLVMAITYGLWLPFAIILGFFLLNGYKGLDAKNRFDEAGRVFYIVFGSIITLVPIIIFMCHIDIIVMGFVNPEYGAIKDIISIVK